MGSRAQTRDARCPHPALGRLGLHPSSSLHLLTGVLPSGPCPFPLQPSWGPSGVTSLTCAPNPSAHARGITFQVDTVRTGCRRRPHQQAADWAQEELALEGSQAQPRGGTDSELVTVTRSG